MTSLLSTPEPADDGAAFAQKQREYDRRAEEIRAANKTVLFDLLASAGIETLTVLFDGYGDSGQIERVDIEAREGTVPLPLDRIEVACTTWEKSGDRTPDPDRSRGR